MHRYLAPSSPQVLLYPIYATLLHVQQAKVFAATPKGMHKCILRTNIAETSITIPGIKYVVDTGKCKEKRYVAKHTGTGASTQGAAATGAQVELTASATSPLPHRLRHAPDSRHHEILRRATGRPCRPRGESLPSTPSFTLRPPLGLSPLGHRLLLPTLHRRRIQRHAAHRRARNPAMHTHLQPPLTALPQPGP